MPFNIRLCCWNRMTSGAETAGDLRPTEDLPPQARDRIPVDGQSRRLNELQQVYCR
jgi:hypothetical protein